LLDIALIKLQCWAIFTNISSSLAEGNMDHQFQTITIRNPDLLIQIMTCICYGHARHLRQPVDQGEGGDRAAKDLPGAQTAEILDTPVAKLPHRAGQLGCRPFDKGGKIELLMPAVLTVATKI
jgi:hypothetical protein